MLIHHISVLVREFFELFRELNQMYRVISKTQCSTVEMLARKVKAVAGSYTVHWSICLLPDISQKLKCETGSSKTHISFKLIDSGGH
jgi:hypothetical protein